MFRGRIVLLVLAGSLAAGCGTLPQISTEVGFCCAPSDEVFTYRIEFEDMPEFLKPMLRDEVAVALDAKSLEYSEGEAQAILTMTLVNTPMTVEGDDDVAEAWGSLSPGGTARFNAKVEMELHKAVSRELIWSGSMWRLHTAGPGAYMHEYPARRAVAEALQVLFADLPARMADQM